MTALEIQNDPFVRHTEAIRRLNSLYHPIRTSEKEEEENVAKDSIKKMASKHFGSYLPGLATLNLMEPDSVKANKREQVIFPNTKH